MVLSLIKKNYNNNSFWLIFMVLNVFSSLFVHKDLSSAYLGTCVVYGYYSLMQMYLNPDVKDLVK